MRGSGSQLQLNQAIQIQMDGREEWVCAVVTNFLEQQIVVRFPQLSKLPEGCEVGAKMSFRFATRAGLATGESAIVDLCAPPRPGIVIAQPESVTVVQNRRFFRVEVNYPCVFTVLAAGQARASKPTEVQARVRDLSGGGACVVTDRTLAPGDVLRVKIAAQSPAAAGASPKAPACPPGRAPVKSGPVRIPTPIAVRVDVIDTQACVVHVTELPSDTGPSFAVGIKFLDVSNALQDRLTALVFDVQRTSCHD